jgi:hypothetical protein
MEFSNAQLQIIQHFIDEGNTKKSGTGWVIFYGQAVMNRSRYLIDNTYKTKGETI